MREFSKYKWYIFTGFTLIGLAFGIAAHAIMFGLVFGLGLGFLSIALIAAIIKINFKQ